MSESDTAAISKDTQALFQAFFGPSEMRRHFDVERIAYLLAAESSARFFMEHFPLAPNLRGTEELITYALGCCKVEGLNVELGVYTGRTAKIITKVTGGATLHCFDSFEGLPEDWTFFQKAGRFDCRGKPPDDLPSSVVCHIGWFDKTLPIFVENYAGNLRFLHIDSDLYSSAKTALGVLGKRIVTGTVIVFDEYFNYPGWEQHEHKAWSEFVADRSVTFEYIGWAGAVTSLAVQITGIR
jgi:Methyltransferase domain